MSENIFRRVMTRLPFELQAVLWHRGARSVCQRKKFWANRSLMR